MTRRSFALFVVTVIVSPIIIGVAYANPIVGGLMFMAFLFIVLFCVLAALIL